MPFRKSSALTPLYHEDPRNHLKIELDRQSLEFSPGESITGKVTLVVKDALELKQISINALGIGRISWAVVDGSTKITDSYSAVEIYLDKTFVVAGDGNTPIPVPLGSTDFPFTFELPLNLPSTFIDDYGSIIYALKLKAELTSSSDLPPLNRLSAFIVNGIVDLNDYKDLAQRAELYDHKSVGCCGCCKKKNKVEILIKFPRRGYVLGENIQWKAEIHNLTSKKIKQINARLVLRTEFNAEGHSKTNCTVVASTTAPGIAPQKKYTWIGMMKIPDDIAPTKLGRSGPMMMNPHYFVEFEVEIGRCSKNLVSEIQVTLGTVALTKRTGDHNDSVSLFGNVATSDTELTKP